MPTQSFHECIIKELEFIEWTKNKSGNVYSLFEEFLKENCECTHITVSFDWMACESVHRYESGKGWITYEKLPKWFKKWVKENGSGKYGTYYGKQEMSDM